MTIGQVGAIRLGISRALQNWEPDLRPALRSGMNILCLYVDLFSTPFFRVSLLLMSVLYMFCCYDESLNYFFLLNLTSRLPNKGFKSGWKEKTRKGQSKKELPMGQALKECHCLDGNFCFEYWRSSITYNFLFLFCITYDTNNVWISRTLMIEDFVHLRFVLLVAIFLVVLTTK
jgi:hypothetical protein